MEKPCPHCTRIIGSRIDLYNHLKTYKDQGGGQSYSTTSDCRWRWWQVLPLTLYHMDVVSMTSPSGCEALGCKASKWKYFFEVLDQRTLKSKDNFKCSFVVPLTRRVSIHLSLNENTSQESLTTETIISNTSASIIIKVRTKNSVSCQRFQLHWEWGSFDASEIHTGDEFCLFKIHSALFSVAMLSKFRLWRFPAILHILYAEVILKEGGWGHEHCKASRLWSNMFPPQYANDTYSHSGTGW